MNSVNSYSKQIPLVLFETLCENQYFTILVLLGCRICLLKNVISVYVDVGECTDAIQHKDRGDFQVTGMLSYTSVELSSASILNTYMIKGQVASFFKNTSNFILTPV